MSFINLAGFSNTLVNGLYSSAGAGTKDGYARYVKTTDSNYIVEYRSEFGPYCFSGSYYVIRIANIGGAIPKTIPMYRNDSSSVGGGTWVSLQNDTAGTIDPLSSSSDSSSSSSVDSSSSSSSELYSSSSSSSSSS